MAKKNEKGGGARKYDRNRVWCEAYRRRGQREKNQAIRLRKHLVRHPMDGCARRRYDAIV
jgi:hypothetical protein